ncbi:16S rRNA (cytosine(1402)-N(4))-methyltransferase RsmH [Candidatus Dojkabacteria bacterium]|nr:16S rRNA (cytosine(1402)-N(4))-methyltransferase RsmH [Candidatus Dojkabacteria bacterium]
MKKYHESVLVKEVIESLHLNTSSRVIDCTLGTGGHTEAIVNAGASVLGIEADPRMLEIAKERLLDKNAKLVLGNFDNLSKIAKENNFTEVDGILFDLGVSNLHLKGDTRGFSFDNPDQDLDMRLNTETQGVKASDLLNALDQTQLTHLFERVLSHNEAKRIAGRIMTLRPIYKVSELIDTLKDMPHKEHLNPATLPMLALRIAVNSELDNLEKIIPEAIGLLKKNGRLLIITFHSGEEEIVQKYMNTRVKIRVPSYSEVNKNVRSRSAKLYVYTKN